MLKSKISADGSAELSDGRGSARLVRLGPGVLHFVCSGVLANSFYESMVAPAQREVDDNGSVVMFVDGWDLRSVDTGFREAWTEWFKKHRQQIRMRLLVRSKLMEMAASLANLFTGISVIKTYASVEAWEQACAGDHRSFRRSSAASG